MKYQKGDIVKGKVTGIESYGLFLLLDDGTTGLIHISEITNSFVNDVHEYAQLGDVMEAKVIGIEEGSQKLQLSIKDYTQHKNEKNNHKIIETETGFAKLEESLKKWIEIKIEEIDKNQKKE